MATRKRTTPETPADEAQADAPTTTRRTKKKATPAKKTTRKVTKKAKPKASASASTGKTRTPASRTADKAAAPRRTRKAAEPAPPPAGETADTDTPATDAHAAAAPVAGTPGAENGAAASAVAPEASTALDDTPIAEAADFPRAAASAPPALEPSPPAQSWRSKRVVFIDVENTSSEASVSRVLDGLDLDGLGTSTEIIAIGNWRVIGQGLARSLAARGAQLVHSAPALRVRDWSDLWIAVQAGIWLGRAHAGDAIEVVSHDRAFDAIGDAACRLGVAFRRITYGDGAGARQSEAPAKDAKSEAGGGRRRGGRGGRGRARGARRSGESATAPARGSAAAAPDASPDAAPDTDAPQSAPPDQIEQVVARLTRDDPLAGVTIERLGAELEAAGFHRPPGSPRLATRLKRLKDIEVMPNGWIRLARADGEAAASAIADEPIGAPDDEPSDDGEGPDQQAAAPRRRSRRRGGRRRGGRSRQAPAETETETETEINGNR